MPLQESRVPCENLVTVKDQPNTQSGVLLHRQGRALHLPCRRHSPGDGMVRSPFGRRRRFYQFTGCHEGGRMDFRHPEYASGEGARLVEEDGPGSGQGFQHVAPLQQDPPAGCGAHAAEQGEGNGDHEGAWAGHHQEDQGPVPPVPESPQACEGGHQGEEGGKDHHSRSVPPGKGRDEPLGGGLSLPGLLDQPESFGKGCLAEGAEHGHREGAAEVDAPGEHFAPLRHVPRDRFSRQGGRIQGGRPIKHLSVEGNPLPRLHEQRAPSRDVLRPGRFPFPVFEHRRPVRADVQERQDGTAGPLHGEGLHQFPRFVKQHHRHRFGELADGESAAGGGRHEKELVEKSPPAEVSRHGTEDLYSRRQVGSYIQKKPGGFPEGQKEGCEPEQGSGGKAEHISLRQGRRSFRETFFGDHHPRLDGRHDGPDAGEEFTGRPLILERNPHSAGDEVDGGGRDTWQHGYGFLDLRGTLGAVQTF